MKMKKIYKCSECGNQETTWSVKCSECGAIGTFEDFNVSSVATGKINNAVYTNTSDVKASKLIDVEIKNNDRITTSLDEFNRVMGGGIIKDSITILTARPGAGKSTLLLQIAQDIAMKGKRVLYASGEESDSQVKARAKRILNGISENIWIIL